MIGGFSILRALAVFSKELIQMRRDRLTFAMMVGLPILQLLMFGYAINTDPRHLSTLVQLHDDGPAVRAIIHGLENSEFFDVKGQVYSDAEAQNALESGQALFIVTIPDNFERDVIRGTEPQILLDIDASDPVAASSGAGAFPSIVASSLSYLDQNNEIKEGKPYKAQPVIHRRYNPSVKTAVNIVPGLLGVILTMTMTMMTAMALTRETERGTLETLLSSPARPAEVMFGKIMPFVLAACIQVAIMLFMARILFDVPFRGSFAAFAAAMSLFVLSNLAIGFFFSTLVKTQMQAMQLTVFYFLPSILLTGFMFPFDGMPTWAQVIGEGLPNTHFMRIVRAVMLKGADIHDVTSEIISLGIILSITSILALTRYRRTLD